MARLLQTNLVMPRHARIDFPGAVHHVYARGIERRDVFMHDDDRRELRRRIDANLTKADVSCLAWAFLPNHFHLVLQSRRGTLSDFMRRVMTGYAAYFNRKYGRVGHLFQNRFKSVVVGTEDYLLKVIRYVHLNPVRAGIVPTLAALAEYPWSGHRCIVRSGRLPWEEFPEIFDVFSRDGESRRLFLYLDYLADGLGMPPDSTHGDEGFEKLHASLSVHRKPADVPPSDPAKAILEDFLAVAAACCEDLGISPDRVFDGKRDRLSVGARRRVLYACVVERGMDRKDVCSWLGITEAGASYLLGAGQRVSRKSARDRSATSPDLG